VLCGITNLIGMKSAGIFYYVGSGSGLVCAKRSDPVKTGPDLQH
jgi:hypothetical protein